MLLQLVYLGVKNAFAMLRLLPMSDRDKDAEILALRHQITVLERQLGKDGGRFAPSDRVFLAALLHRLPRDVLRRVRLLVGPDTVLRRQRPGQTSARAGVRAEAARPAAHRALRPCPGVAPGADLARAASGPGIGDPGERHLIQRWQAPEAAPLHPEITEADRQQHA